MSTIRELAIKLLDDTHGINTEAWYVLYSMLQCSGEEHYDIIRAIQSTEGRYYLPVNHGLRG